MSVLAQWCSGAGWCKVDQLIANSGGSGEDSGAGPLRTAGKSKLMRRAKCLEKAKVR